MAPSSGQIELTYAGTSIQISVPNVPYTSRIEMALDIVELDSGLYITRDEGSTYDKRICECEFDLTATEQNNLNTFLNTTARGQSVILTLPSGSGFFPFGPDKGDTGDFTVSAIIISHGRIQDSPFRYFRTALRFVNVGSFPAYALPAEIDDGTITIGSITTCRFPPNLFQPQVNYEVNTQFTENSTPYYFDRGSGGDFKRNSFVMVSNESKAAAIINYLTGSSGRDASFNLVTAAHQYPFGRDHAEGTYTVQLVKNQINIKHINYNEFEFEMFLHRVSGPV